MDGKKSTPDQPVITASSDGAVKLSDGMSTICLSRKGVAYLQEKLKSLQSFLGSDRTYSPYQHSEKSG